MESGEESTDSRSAAESHGVAIDLSVSAIHQECHHHDYLSVSMWATARQSD